MIRRLPATIVVALIALSLLCAVALKTQKSAPGLIRALRVISSACAGGLVEQGGQPVEKAVDRTTDKGLAAINSAAAAEKYLFIFFYRNQNEQTQKMRKVFDATMQKLAERAEAIAINTTDPSEKGVIDKFKVSRAPMPLVLALAPNGAVTKSFLIKFDEKQLLDAFVSPGMEKTLKALQDSKYVFLCVQNAETKQNDAAMKGVRDFKADTKYSKTTEIITLDPADSAEAKLLKKFGIDPKTDQAITVFLVPPGQIVAKFKGDTDKKTLVAKLAACGTSCGPTGIG